MPGSKVHTHLGVNNTVSIPDSKSRSLIASCHGEFQAVKGRVGDYIPVPITIKSLSWMSRKYGDEHGYDRHGVVETMRERERDKIGVRGSLRGRERGPTVL